MTAPSPEVLRFRAQLSQRLAWAKAVLHPQPQAMHAMSEVVKRATDWESLPASMREFIERAERQQPRPGRQR